MKFTPACDPINTGNETVASLPQGELHLNGPLASNVAAVRVDVLDLSKVEAHLRQRHIAAARGPACGGATLWIEPGHAHGIWLGFRKVDH